MHASKDVRLVKCLDGLDYSFALLDHAYDGLHDTCVGINTDHSELVPALSKCWMIVDLIHRIREIAQALPGLSRKNRELVSFLNATGIAKRFRHYIQHLREELAKSEMNPFPVWGTLSWIDGEDPTKSYTAFAGAMLPGTQYHGCVFDTHDRTWVSSVTLVVDSLSFNFDPIYEACSEFRDFVIPWIIDTYAPGITVSEDTPIITARFLTGPKEEA